MRVKLPEVRPSHK